MPKQDLLVLIFFHEKLSFHTPPSKIHVLKLTKIKHMVTSPRDQISRTSPSVEAIVRKMFGSLFRPFVLFYPSDKILYFLLRF